MRYCWHSIRPPRALPAIDTIPNDMRVSLIGRSSRCKLSFSKAADCSSSSASDTPEVRVWWTSNLCPSQEQRVDQTSEFGFCPAGKRLLPARLAHRSAAEIAQEVNTDAHAILLMIGADAAFHKGRPRPSRGGVSPIKAIVARTRERLGPEGGRFAVALSVDSEDDLDASATKTFVTAVKEELAAEDVPFVAVSPETEIWLREQEAEGGRVVYRRGGSHFRIPGAFEQLMDKKDIMRARVAFDVCGGTGIIDAVSSAVALGDPTLVFPVADFGTLQSTGWGGDGAPAAVLRTCRIIRPSSTARDIFDLEKEKGIYSGGEVESAEVMPIAAAAEDHADISTRGPDTPIGVGAFVVRLSTTQRMAQTWKSGSLPTGPGGKGGKALACVHFGDLRSKERRRGRS